jgi:hypothetical protein
MARLAKTALLAAALLGSLTAAATWYWNRDVAPPTLAEEQQSYQRAVGWLRANEAHVLKDGNSALWWMVQTAAERTGDDYLKGLVRQSMAIAYGDDGPTVPWKRIVDPDAEVALNLVALQPLEPYQRFFYHAVTCQAVDLDDGSDTSRFLQGDVCRPLATRVYATDAVCTTHQLIGVRLFQRVGCATPVDLNKLQSELLADIDQQMRWDVLFKDAYLQRVLMLQWFGTPGQVKPVWMRRVLGAQQADGGWVGQRHVPEMSAGLQLWGLRGRPAPTNFHATAQGLLIAALAITEKPR